MEAAFSISSSRSSTFRFPALQNPSLTISFPSSLKLPTTRSTKWPAQILLSCQPRPQATDSFHGLCYVVGDNIDTDQMIQAEYCTLVSTIPDEYKKLGSHALEGLPADTYPTRFVDEGRFESKYSIIVGGHNFGCGSSREHAPMALGAAGTAAVVAESFARIFFRNSVSTGEVYPLEAEVRICDECSTGDEVTVELQGCRLVNHTTGKEYRLKPIGDAGPVIEAGGIFAYARKSGMIPSLAD